MNGELRKATFAGGCFWCMQPPFRNLEGVVEVVSGYAGGTKADPTYEEVSSGTTGHFEAVQVTYDPAKVSYTRLLEVFWHQIDPTDSGGQFADQGPQYRTAIFYHDEEQHRLAEESKRNLEMSGKFRQAIATQILPYTNFYPAEDYHQDYDQKNPGRYAAYKSLSGREPYIRKTWETSHKKVTIYTTPGCTTCRTVREFLRSRKIDFDEINIAEDAEARERLAAASGYVGAPVIQAGNEFVFGFERAKIEALLAKIQ